MDLYSKSLDIVRSIRAPGKIREIELDLVPALIEPHRHSTDKRLDPGSGLIVRSSEPAPDVLIVEDLHFEGEIFLEVLDDHHQEGQLYTQRLVWVCGAGYKCGTHVRPHDF